MCILQAKKNGNTEEFRIVPWQGPHFMLSNSNTKWKGKPIDAKILFPPHGPFFFRFRRAQKPIQHTFTSATYRSSPTKQFNEKFPKTFCIGLMMFVISAVSDYSRSFGFVEKKYAQCTQGESVVISHRQKKLASKTSFNSMSGSEITSSYTQIK